MQLNAVSPRLSCKGYRAWYVQEGLQMGVDLPWGRAGAAALLRGGRGSTPPQNLQNAWCCCGGGLTPSDSELVVLQEVDLKLVQSWPRVTPKVGAKSTNSWPKAGQKSAQSCPKVSQKSTQNRPKVGPKSVKSQPKVGVDQAPSQPQVGPELAQSRPRVGPGQL